MALVKIFYIREKGSHNVQTFIFMLKLAQILAKRYIIVVNIHHNVTKGLFLFFLEREF